MQSAKAPYFIGLDLGTSSAKAVAFSPRGEAIARHSIAYEMQHPEPDAAVQETGTVLDAALATLRELLRKLKTTPAAIGLSSAMHSLIAFDGAGRPISPLITWADGRARPYAEALRGTDRGKYFYRRSGTPIHAMSPLCKLLWLREQRPDTFQAAARFAGIKEYLLFHAFGEWVVDHSLASATGLFDLEERRWIPEALVYTGLDREQLPRPVPVGYTVQDLRSEVATFLQLPPRTPWVVGASDGCLANLGAGSLAGDEAVLTIGTSGAIRRTVDHPVYDPQERLFCYVLDDTRYVTGGPSNNGGIVWEWFCEQFFPECTMEEIFAQVTTVPAGAEGLLFLPYLFGERAPVWDASAKGHFWGIEARHGRAHFARSVLEGICLNLAQITGALESRGGAIRRIHANGGFIRSPLWVQLLADVLGKEVIVDHQDDASAWGAAIMAMNALDRSPPPSDEGSAVRYRPDPQLHRRYREVLARFKRIYPSASVS